MKQANDPLQFDKAEDSTGFLLWQVTNLWQREIRKALIKYDLTHSQFVLLASVHWLTLTRQDVTQILLSSHTRIDPMTTSTVLGTLQFKGLIMRQEHSTDTRAKTVALTTSGLKVIKKAVKTIDQFDDSFFGPLGEKTKELNKTLQTMLDKGGRK
jgi:MarR family transcriptional regulator, organic hydroperoxide resistance regulator